MRPPSKLGSIVRGQRVTREKLRFAKSLRRSMTPAERLLWAILRRSRTNGLHFRRQQVIGKYVVDFYCDAARLAIELDGEPHEMRADHDFRRDGELQQLGVSVIRMPNETVRAEPDMVAVWIAARARERMEELTGPNPRPLP